MFISQKNIRSYFIKNRYIFNKLSTGDFVYEFLKKIDFWKRSKK